MPQEVLDLHCGSVLEQRLLFFWRTVFIDICNSGLTDFVELVMVYPNDSDRPSINETFQFGRRVLRKKSMSDGRRCRRPSAYLD
jgi:hypothetical protein